MIRLTTRETEVMQGVCDGLTNREIGKKLGLSHRTVEIHRNSAIRALGGKNGAHAAVLFDRMVR
jgi:two-component system nitrate/nitrite response regulator NarL